MERDILRTLADKGRNVIRAGETHIFKQSSDEIPNPHLWSTDDPYLYLYSVKTCISHENSCMDSTDTTFGMRWIKWSKEDITDKNGSIETAGHTIDKGKLYEEPSSLNNYFTRYIKGSEKSKLAVSPCGVEIHIASVISAIAVYK